MNIPDSIAKLTTEIPSDSFINKPVEPILNLDEVVLLIKRSLNLQQLQSFEKGLNFFKSNISTDKNIAQNFIGLISEIVISSFKDSKIQEDYKTNLSLSTKHAFNSIVENLESIFKNINMLNKDENLLDVKEFTLIILGYAIGSLKKIHNSRS